MYHGKASGSNAIADLGTRLIDVPRIRGEFHAVPCLPTGLDRTPHDVPRRLLVDRAGDVSERTSPSVGVAARGPRRS